MTTFCPQCLKKFPQVNAGHEFCTPACATEFRNAVGRERTAYRKDLRTTRGGRNGQKLNRSLSDMPDGNFQ